MSHGQMRGAAWAEAVARGWCWCCAQVLGRDRERVRELGRRLGLEGTYVARSYIEQVRAGVRRVATPLGLSRV